MSTPDTKTSFSNYSKISFIGDPKVGKTSLIGEIIGREYKDDYQPTIGLKYYNLSINSSDDTDNNIYLQIWDISGEELSSKFMLNYIKNSTLIILVFDYNNNKSQETIKDLYNLIHTLSEPKDVILVGTKFEKKRKDTPKKLKSFV